MSKILSRLEWRIPLLYALLGVLWIFLTDRLLALLVTDPAWQLQVQNFKGWLFVLMSTLLIFFILRADQVKYRRAEQALKASEARFRMLFETSLDAILLTAPDGKIHSANPAACQLFGRTEEEIIRLGRDGMVDLTDPRLPLALEERQQTGRFRGELTFVRSDGSKFIGELSSSLFQENEDRIHTNMVIRDVTEQKATQDALQISEQKYRSLIGNISDIVWILDLSLQTTYVSPSIEQVLGFTPEERLHQTLEEMLTPESLQRARALLEKELDQLMHADQPGHKTSTIDMEYFHKNGGVVVMENRVTWLMNEQGKPTGILGVSRDITERKRIEAALVENEKRFASIFHANPASIAVTRLADNRLVDVNPAWQETTGISREDAVGRQVEELNLWVYPEEREKLLHSIREKGKTQSEMHLRRRSGELRNLLISVDSFELAGERYLLTMAQDITEEKQAEETLRALTARQEALLAAVPDIVMEVDNEKVYTWANPAGIGFFGTDVIGKKADDYFEGVQDTYKVVQPLFNGDEHTIYVESWQRRKDGQKRLLAWWCRNLKDEDGTVIGAISSARDITENLRAEQALQDYNERLEREVEARTGELRDAQEALVRQEKLATLGQLAGGVGHELRNPLGVINNAVYYLQMILPKADKKVKDYLSMIKRETTTAEKIINDLLDFSRIKSVDREPVAVHELFERVLARFPAPENVQVRMTIPTDLPQVFVDTQQIEQVVGNLVLNAYQAMPDGGTLTVSTIQAKRTVSLAIKDEGVGITPENMGKLFEPLFTTKPKGIGLGLAVSKKLAEANDSRIEVKSKLGEGSTFTIVLPLQGSMSE